MKLKPEKVKLSVNGKTIDRGKLTKKTPRIVWYSEHSAITKELNKDKSKETAKTEYKARAVRTILTAAIQILEDLSELDRTAADTIRREFFIRPLSSPVAFPDGEPVNLDDFEG